MANYKITYVVGTNSSSQRYDEYVEAPSNAAARKKFEGSHPNCKIIAVN